MPGHERKMSQMHVKIKAPKQSIRQIDGEQMPPCVIFQITIERIYGDRLVSRRARGEKEKHIWRQIADVFYYYDSRNRKQRVEGALGGCCDTFDGTDLG